MLVASFFFYLFATLTIASGLMVITARNPVHSVFFLILSFFNAAGLFVLLGAELLAMILVVVYVGAVAVLFLFVVMMLDINIEDMREGFKKHLLLGLTVGAVLVVELLLVFAGEIRAATPLAEPAIGPRSNTAMIGDVLYTDYLLNFQLAGLVLLVAMIGAIVLTMRHREGVKRQNIAKQIERRRDDTITIAEVESRVPPDTIKDARATGKKLR